ncbi:hypothetical protein B0T24DRAFT_599951 [Lasiosphaeria ovina]|uniref:Uncharacterized protein n=1 Tax=Lasiosphaeria ovina TaxID=92902 RepID=A0AAE0MXS1_9PEZI|nr:hypothetical protein B0T24DRAFT_599951 [Lasiosphaeria ovina]
MQQQQQQKDSDSDRGNYPIFKQGDDHHYDDYHDDDDDDDDDDNEDDDNVEGFNDPNYRLTLIINEIRFRHAEKKLPRTVAAHVGQIASTLSEMPEPSPESMAEVIYEAERAKRQNLQ